MPFSPKHPCNHPGCPRVTDKELCEEHTRLEQKKLESERPSAFERGYDARWHKERRAWLLAHPFCALCLRTGKLVAATIVDHIVPHKGEKNLFWDKRNWQSVCKLCHDSKTAKENGRWDRRRRGGGKKVQ